MEFVSILVVFSGGFYAIFYKSVKVLSLPRQVSSLSDSPRRNAAEGLVGKQVDAANQRQMFAESSNILYKR